MLNSVSCVYADQFAIIKNCVALSTQTCFETCTQVMSSVIDCVSDALLNAAVQNVPMTFSDVNNTQK